MKKKMDDITKVKLIYSGELLLFSIVFLTIAILKFTNVIPFNQTRATIFNWITIFGGTWLIADLIWALVDKKRQQRVALVDKFLHAPIGVYLIVFDLYCLITQPSDSNIYQYGIPIALSYLGICYLFESFYHFKKPIPGLIEEELKSKDNKENSSKEESEEKIDE